MHVMTKYIDTYKAAIAALEDYCAMQQIIDTTDQQIKDAYNAVTSVSSARLDGMPHAPNPRGGEDRIAATLDKVDAYRARYAQAREYMDWFLPAWGVLSEDDLSQEERVRAIADHFYVERSTAHTKKSRAVRRLASALFG